MSNELIKGLCVVVILIAVGAFIYSVINAFVVQKRNKKQEAVNRQIFMAQNGLLDKDISDVKRHENIKYDNDGINLYNQSNNKTSDFNSLNSILNYDEPYEDPTFEEIQPNGKSLKDFYSN